MKLKEVVAGSKIFRTWELPGLALVEVDLGDGAAGEGAVEDFLEQVEGDELLVGGVEPEARGQLRVAALKVGVAVALH